MGKRKRISCIIEEKKKLPQGITQQVRYFDRNGKEVTENCEILYPSGKVETVYLTEDGYLGTDATNPVWIENGRAVPCEYGIYPLTEDELKDVEVVI